MTVVRTFVEPLVGPIFVSLSNEVLCLVASFVAWRAMSRSAWKVVGKSSVLDRFVDGALAMPSFRCLRLTWRSCAESSSEERSSESWSGPDEMVAADLFLMFPLERELLFLNSKTDGASMLSSSNGSVIGEGELFVCVLDWRPSFDIQMTFRLMSA